MPYFFMIRQCLTFYASLFVGTSVCLMQQPKKKGFPLRVLLSYATGVLIMNQMYLIALKGYSSMTVIGNATIYMTALCLMWPITHFCFDITWSEACFCAVAGYGAQNTQSIVYEFIRRSFSLTSPIDTLAFLGTVAVVYALLYFYIGRNLRRGQNFVVEKWQLLLLLTFVIIVEIMIFYNMRQMWIHMHGELMYQHMQNDCILLGICSVTVLTIQFSFLTQHDLTTELNIIKQMWHKDQEQFRISGETIDLINQKCHDMRFQIRSIGKNANVEPEALRTIEKSIGIYDSLYKTGCRALDIILTEKSLLCQASGIIISCIADTENLNFLSDSDIYSLFGNLLENAMHAVSGLDINMRTIDLTIRQHGDLLSINSHNNYAGELLIVDGLPVTNNKDTDYHGYGVKSISAIVKKYGGTVSFQAKNGVFNVNILFPLVK